MAAPPGPAGPIRGLDHVAICVEGGSLADRADFYQNAFGFFRYSSGHVAVGEQAMESIVVRSPGTHAALTFVAPDPGRSAGQLDAFLELNRGPGVQHLAFLVDEIIPAVHGFQDRGVEFLRIPDAYDDLLRTRFAPLREKIPDLRAAHVLADHDQWGYLLQSFTRAPHERGTLFFEIVQRQGSRRFDSADIRALYDVREAGRPAAG